MKKNLALAIDLGATNLRAAVVSQKGKIIEKAQEKTIKKGKNGRIVVKQTAALIKRLIAKQNKDKILGIGVSGAGLIDSEKGEIIKAPNLPFRRISLTPFLKKEFSLPVFLFNDCNTAAWGEKYFGKEKNIQNLVYITISTGIGAGVIVGGNLLIGNKGNAAEVGHMIIDSKYQLKCGCKRKNHWEAYASGKNIPNFFKKWLKESNIKTPEFDFSSAKNIFLAARQKNKIALSFLKELGKINARATSNVIACFAPELIVFGGSVVLNNPKLILEPIKKQVENLLPRPKIKKTSLNEDVSLLGAASMVFWPPFRDEPRSASRSGPPQLRI